MHFPMRLFRSESQRAGSVAALGASAGGSEMELEDDSRDTGRSRADLKCGEGLLARTRGRRVVAGID